MATVGDKEWMAKRHGVVAEDCDVGEAEGWNEFAVQAMVSVTLGLGLGVRDLLISRTPLGKGGKGLFLPL